MKTKLKPRNEYALKVKVKGWKTPRKARSICYKKPYEIENQFERVNLTTAQWDSILIEDSPEEQILNHLSINKIIHTTILRICTKRERIIIEDSFGIINESKPLSYRKIASQLNITLTIF